MADKMRVVISCGTAKVKSESQSITEVCRDSRITIPQKTSIGIANNIISNYLVQFYSPLIKNFNVDGYNLINKMLDNIKVGNFVPLSDYKDIFKEVLKLEIKTVAAMYGVDFTLVDGNVQEEINKIITNICNDLIKII